MAAKVFTLFRRLSMAVMLLLGSIAMATNPAAAQSDEIQSFERELEPYGRWVDHAGYGQVWVPDVDADWRPYSRGTWAHTEEHGWYWESDEPFGWAVFHYGRWFLDDDLGWAWVPGDEWGPAWVAWRYDDENVGWAPLPPEAEYRDGEIVHATSFYDSPRFSPAWCFVPVAMLTAPRLWTHIAPPRRNRVYLARTRFIPHRRGSRPYFFNGGFDRGRWERLTGRTLASRRLVPSDRADRGRPRGRDGGDIPVYRPRVTGLPRDGARPFDRPRGDGRDGRPVQRPREDWRDRRPDERPRREEARPTPTTPPQWERPRLQDPDAPRRPDRGREPDFGRPADPKPTPRFERPRVQDTPDDRRPDFGRPVDPKPIPRFERPRVQDTPDDRRPDFGRPDRQRPPEQRGEPQFLPRPQLQPQREPRPSPPPQTEPRRGGDRDRSGGGGPSLQRGGGQPPPEQPPSTN
jgi:hypothetical protein